MKVGFLALFREIDGDEDPFSKWLRVLRSAYGAVLFGSVMLMTQSAWHMVVRGNPFDHTLIRLVIGIGLPSIFIFLCWGSFYLPGNLPGRATQIFISSTPGWYRTPRVVLITSTIVTVHMAAEATTFLGWWDLKEVPVWWRKAILVLLGGWLLLWAGERIVRVLRSGSKRA